MAILLFINLKGGVAKTTNSVGVAECLADAGHRVLVLDADHQCTASELLLGEDRLLDRDHRKFTLHDLLAAMLDDDFEADHIEPYVVDGVSNIGGGIETLSVLPCSLRIDDFETNMARARRGYRSGDEWQSFLGKRTRAVRSWLRNRFDFTIVDCPPSMALQVKFLMNVSDAFVLPTVPDRLSVRGSLYLIDRLRRLGSKKRGLGTLWSLYREQNAMHREIVASAAAGENGYDSLPTPFETMIPNATAVTMASEPGRDHHSFSAKYGSAVAKRFRELCDEIVSRSEFGKVEAKTAVAAAQ